MSKHTIPKELKKLEPFFHDIDLGNGLNTAPEIYRMRSAINLFFPPLLKLFGGSLKGLRILDVGCNCGGFSFEANKYGAKEIIGIDADKNNINQANAIKKYLRIPNIKFLQLKAEELDKGEIGKFDITILAGILYHLENPISTMAKIAEITKSTLMVDCHVHYSTGPDEDTPSWWMLNDMDEGNLEGLFIDDEVLSAQKILDTQKNIPVDYNQMQHQFIPSPHTIQDMELIKRCLPHPKLETIKKYCLGAANQGGLVLIPNKKALFKLIRYFGFEDILEITPHRFSGIPYTNHYRIGFFAFRRNNPGHFPISEYQQLFAKIPGKNQ